MHEQFLNLKNHLLAIDKLVTENATRIPEAVREPLVREVHSGLAIMVAAEALEDSPLERRAFMLQQDDLNDQTPGEWVRSASAYVWLNTETGKYHFCDEADQFDPTAYDTEEAAKAALDLYVATHLNPPEPTEAATAPQDGATGAEDTTTATEQGA